MEKEYIDRKIIKNNLHFTKEGIFYHNGKAYIDLSVVDKIILETPAADVNPIRHGKWLERHGESYLVSPMKYDEDGLPVLQPYIYYECSECGKIVSKQYPYCNCGAKMDGGNSNA